MNKIIFIALLFGLVSTCYFGWNWNAESHAERVCDCIFIAALCAGLYREYGQ